jgi:N-acetyl-anhydromuramyl-L-alanine amidase AmpD
MAVNRYTPHVDYTEWSPNKSSRGGAHPTLIVIHATVSNNVKGLADLRAIGSWFSRPSTQASSHVCTDNEGNSARYVRDSEKAWHCANFNRMSLGIEQILPGSAANQGQLTRDLYRETARWVARWSKMYGIPIRKGAVSGSQVTKSGVIRHSELGAAGGGHADPGLYDMDAMMNLARFYRSKI